MDRETERRRNMSERFEFSLSVTLPPLGIVVFKAAEE